jgi:DNA (cytosine-5)-methyltransferase 1
MKPRLLDLFCGAGGAATGYANVGFEVVGVDIRPQPNYPFRFIQGDALRWLRRRAASGSRGFIDQFDAVHASPLWWRWTAQARSAGTSEDHPDDVTPALVGLAHTGKPFVLEIGTLTPLPSVTICGVSCGLKVTRHMRFVTNWPLMVPPCTHHHGGAADGDYLPYRGSYHKERPTWRTVPNRRQAWREAAGIGWMTSSEADLAVPPAYTELIGTQLGAYLQGKEAA